MEGGRRSSRRRLGGPVRRRWSGAVVGQDDDDGGVAGRDDAAGALDSLLQRVWGRASTSRTATSQVPAAMRPIDSVLGGFEEDLEILAQGRREER